jgi:hypothetical protein
MMRLSGLIRQQPELTPVVPFKNKIHCYQLKQSFLITLYNSSKNHTAKNETNLTLKRQIQREWTL